MGSYDTRNSRTGRRNCLKPLFTWILSSLVCLPLIFNHMLNLFICYIEVYFTFAFVDCVHCNDDFFKSRFCSIHFTVILAGLNLLFVIIYRDSLNWGSTVHGMFLFSCGLHTYTIILQVAITTPERGSRGYPLLRSLSQITQERLATPPGSMSPTFLEQWGAGSLPTELIRWWCKLHICRHYLWEQRQYKISNHNVIVMIYIYTIHLTTTNTVLHFTSLLFYKGFLSWSILRWSESLTYKKNHCTILKMYDLFFYNLDVSV